MAPGTKRLPVAVSVSVDESTEMAVGLMAARIGSGLVMGRTRLFDMDPTGDGLRTVIVALPAGVRYPDGIVAVSCVLLTKVVVNVTLFHLMAAPERK